jgi:hypothetical protein
MQTMMGSNLVENSPKKVMSLPVKRKNWTRLVQRAPTFTLVRCRPYAMNGALHTSDGVILNYSRNGMYIETSSIFTPGTILMIRKTGKAPLLSPLEAQKTHPASLSLAEVKWITELVEENSIRFGMGLAFVA